MKSLNIRFSLLLFFVLLWVFTGTFSIVRANTTSQEEIQLYSSHQSPVHVTMGEAVSYPVGTGDFVLRRTGEEEPSGPLANWDSHLLAEMVNNGLLKASVSIEQGEERLSLSPSLDTERGRLFLSFQPAHTYGVTASDFSLRIRLTALQPIYRGNEKDEYSSQPGEDSENTVPVLQQGEAFSGIVPFSASYQPVPAFDNPLSVTLQNVADGEVLVDGKLLYKSAQDKKGIAQIRFSLDSSERNTAMFTFLPAQNQGSVNLFYTHSPIAAIHSAYPGVSFYFLSFPGEPSLSTSGSLTFPALNGENTVVYHWDSKGPIRMESVYDKVSKTVTVQGIRKLDRYVAAPAPLEELFESNPNMGGC